MALTGYKVVEADTPAELNTLVAAEIAAGNSPLGQPSLVQAVEYPPKHRIAQAIGVGLNSVTQYKVVTEQTAVALTTTVTALVPTWSPIGGVVIVPYSPTVDVRKHLYCQAVIQGTVAAAGVAAHTHAAADITSGTVAEARLPIATNAVKGIASFGSGTTVTAGAVTVP